VQPLASLKALADPIYEAFYGLKEQPFAITTDPKFFYSSASHQLAFSELSAGLRRREPLLLLTGETGTGKTTLCRTVLDTLGERTFSAMILNPYMSGVEVFRIILRDFGLVSPEDLRRGVLATADTTQMLETLEAFLRSLRPIDCHAVLVIDEAQSVAPQVLDQLRLLTGLEQDGQPLVQIVLCGQQNLLQTLKSDALAALNERISRRVTLAPLAPNDVGAYIAHRLTIAGGANSVTFDPAAVRVVAELAHGLPRRVNVLCDRALQEGRIAGVNVITADIVKRSARAVAGAHEIPADPEPAAPAPAAPATDDTLRSFGETPVPSRGPRRLVITAVGAIVAAVLLGAGYRYYRSASAETGPLPTPGPPAHRTGDPAGPLAAPPPEQLTQPLTIPPGESAPIARPPAATPPATTPPAAPAAAPPTTVPPTSN
jgi:general secretion pathway protein A